MVFLNQFIFLIVGKNTFLAFIHQLILQPPHTRAHRFACDGISASEILGLKHLPMLVGMRMRAR